MSMWSEDGCYSLALSMAWGHRDVIPDTVPPGSGPDLPLIPCPKEISDRSQISQIHPASLIYSMSVIWTPL